MDNTFPLARAVRRPNSDRKIEWPRNIRSREIHANVRSKIVHALRGRSWNWLAERSRVPQSTLARQAAHPKFSVEVLWRVAQVLDVDIGYFFPTGRERDVNDDVQALRKINEIASRWAEREGITRGRVDPPDV